MRAILVGLGNAGFGWYKRLRAQGLLHAVVEVDPAMRAKMEGDAYPFYSSLQDALENETADFLVNVTTPLQHTQVNHAAFDRKLPVLSEKPISFDYGESVDVVRRAEREKIPFMIAENYRCFPYIRKMKQLIEEGAIGDLSYVSVEFARYHHEPVRRKYAVHVLDDIGVHHMDLIRYFCNSEGRFIQARQINPIGGWQEEGAVLNADVWLEMERDISVSYTGSIAARGRATPWSGNWRIEGTDGAIMLTDEQITLVRQGSSTPIADFKGINTRDCLSEFLDSLRNNREAETSGRQYLNTQALVHYAKLSAEAGSRVAIALPVRETE